MYGHKTCNIKMKTVSSSCGVSLVVQARAEEENLKSLRLWLALLWAILVPAVSPII